MAMIGTKSLLAGTGLVCIVVLVGTMVVLWARRSDPVVFSLWTDIRDQHGRQILNPFRDREPEYAASAILHRFEKQDCGPAMRTMGASDARTLEVCTKEKAYPLVGWRLAARRDEGGSSVLRYDVERRDAKGTFHDPVWITAQSSGTTWKVAAYEPWY